jgi:hypothetical protein
VDPVICRGRGNPLDSRASRVNEGDPLEPVPMRGKGPPNRQRCPMSRSGDPDQNQPRIASSPSRPQADDFTSGRNRRCL